ncbi:outer membrane lipoprotein LolB [Oxalobacteraceae bacterium CAVE-383]|nr:outer membrane lipoprotein LolB [Oxalobacteraceae bacterium CAVE-383]
MTLYGRGWRASASALALGFALLGAGCANLTPPGVNAGAGMQTQSPRAYRQDIVLEGRLSLRYQQNQEDRSVHGSFVWTQTAGQTSIRLLSPLGQTIALIDVRPGIATLTQSGQAPRSAANVDELTAQALGWPLPIAGLRDWLQGFATDAAGKAFVAQAPANGDDAVAVKTQDGWRIQYLNWQAAAATGGAGMPKRIDLDRYTEQAGQVAIRIVIDKTS